MAVRSGGEFIANLKRHPREVWVAGERVEDITEHPAFAESVRQMAALFDRKLDPAYIDRMTYIEPDTGARAPTALMPARSPEDLKKRGESYRLTAEATFGMMGRSPDFMQAVTLGFRENAEQLGKNGPEFTQRMEAYYKYVRDNDLFLSHALVTPQNDRSRSSVDQADDSLHLRIVDETPKGLIVRGARMLATYGPICDEVLMYNLALQMQPGEEANAIIFAVPTDIPGLRQIARPPYRTSGSLVDFPLSARFEENDSLLIFNDVLVPWDRVFSYRDIHIAKTFVPSGSAYIAHCNQARAIVKMQFATGVAMAVAESIGAAKFLHVQEMLGECLMYVELLKASILSAETTYVRTSVGTVRCSPVALAAGGRLMSRAYPRVIEILQTIGGGGLMMQPHSADFLSPEIGADVAKYYQGAAGLSSIERVKLFKLAWDLAGEAFGARTMQYERYHSGDPVRLFAQFYLNYGDAIPRKYVEQALGSARADVSRPDAVSV